jgi:hypothetical protein
LTIKLNSVLTWPPHSARTIITQYIINIWTQLLNFLVSIVKIQHDDRILDDIFINKHILHGYTYR